MVMIIPINTNVNKTEYITNKNRHQRFQVFGAISMWYFHFYTMMVIIIANTPSLNASNLPFPINFYFKQW